MIKVGCDIAQIKRFKKPSKELLNKLFHKSELKNTKPETLAGIFAAKESCKKVFNDLKWHDIEVVKNRNGKSSLILNKYKEIKNYDLSISHDGDYAMAVFIVSNEN